MKPIRYPVEQFAWQKHDEGGNVRFEIRDADRNFVMFLSIKGREFHEAKRLEEELVPMVVRLMNTNAMLESTGTPSNEPLEASNGNGHSKTPEQAEVVKSAVGARNPWGRKGRPK